MLPMTVQNTAFLIERLGQDCHPLQFLRELTQNAIEAIQQTGKPGKVVWDYDAVTYQKAGVRKLCVMDNGDGMTGAELVQFINKLSSSGSRQSMSGNYGVGAKIATACRNPQGVVYCSWNEGQGSMVHLCRDAKTGDYGLRSWEVGNQVGYCLPLTAEARPAAIREHGTLVVLHGTSEDEDTTLPAGITNPCWIAKYLNSRYFRFPRGVTVHARDFGKEPGDLRRITGQKAHLDQHAASRGQVTLSGAVVHWWILKCDESRDCDSDCTEPAGHVAALYGDELYEIASGRAGITRLQQFGIPFGGRRVVLYVEPTGQAGSITTNTARTMLLLNNESLLWAQYASEFREHMPAEIRALVQAEAQASVSNDHKQEIRRRLQGLFSPVKHIAPGGTDLYTGPGPRSTGKRTQSKNKMPSNAYAGLAMTPEPAGKRKTVAYPDVHWVNVKDGTRQPGEMGNRAGCYCPEPNVLKINEDFPAFAQLVQLVHAQAGCEACLLPVVKGVVRGWYEQALIETIVGAQAMRRCGMSDQDISALTSEEALSAAVLSRYHLSKAAKWELGTKLGAMTQFKQPADKVLVSIDGHASAESAAA
jgi:hypothetical protein